MRRNDCLAPSTQAQGASGTHFFQFRTPASIQKRLSAHYPLGRPKFGRAQDHVCASSPRLSGRWGDGRLRAPQDAADLGAAGPWRTQDRDLHRCLGTHWSQHPLPRDLHPRAPRRAGTGVPRPPRAQHAPSQRPRTPQKRTTSAKLTKLTLKQKCHGLSANVKS